MPSLRSLARRRQHPPEAAQELEVVDDKLVSARPSQIGKLYDIGAGTAAEIFMLIRDNPKSIESDDALTEAARLMTRFMMR